MQLIRASTGDSIPVTAFQPPTTGFDIVVLNAEIELVSKAKLRPGTTLELNALDISAHLQSRFESQVPRKSTESIS